MNKLLYILLLFSFFQRTFSQNLIINGHFESYLSCPDEAGKIEYAHPWNGAGTSADYFNKCANLSTPNLSIPYSFSGYQDSYSGDAYVGIMGFYHFSKREYIQIEIVEPLLQNKIYKVELYVNLYNHSKYAINNIAAAFLNNSFETFDENVIELNPNILNFDKPFLDDTMNWIQIQGVYKSLGNERFLIIGNFNNNLSTELKIVNDIGSDYAYYFIDDVSVEEITEPFWQYRDTLVHYGDSVLIGPAITGLDIDWYTADMQFLGNAPGIYVSPETSRSYIAKERFNGNETTHTVFVTVLGGAGILENKLEHVAIYPNPSTASFFVVGKNLNEEITLTLSDLNGKVVHSEQRFFSGQDEKVEFDVKAGVYFLRMKMDGGNEVVRKIVVR